MEILGLWGGTAIQLYCKTVRGGCTAKVTGALCDEVEEAAWVSEGQTQQEEQPSGKASLRNNPNTVCDDVVVPTCDCRCLDGLF